MEYFKTYSFSSLTELGNLHDEWIRNVWLQYATKHPELYSVQDAIESSLHRPHRKPDRIKWQHILVHVDGESTPPLTLKVRRKKYTLKDIKRLLDDIIYTEITWRYFFLNWSNELCSTVKDELLMGNQIVPTYNSDIVLHINM